MCLFNLGQTVTTPAALRFCEQHSINLLELLRRHHNGDFGDIGAADAKANTFAIQHDERIFSSYKFPQGVIWVITEATRASTCVLTPSCY
jgi:hypothetical protein